MNTVTFDRAPPPGTVNFGIGQPSMDLLPVELMRRAADDFLRRAEPQDLNYGAREGDPGFRASLAAFLTEGYGAAVDAASLFVTAGNSQALDFCCSIFARPGDVVVVEEPSYFLAFQVFKDHGLDVVGVPVDDDGLRVDVLEERLESVRPTLLYTIPSFHNPSGRTLSAERRRRLVDLSREHDFVILADEVYQLLHYGTAPPPALGTFVDEGNVLSLGSFSKILAPALRLGWIQTSPALLERLLASGAVNSGGSLNHFTSQVVRRAIDLGLQEAHLETLRAAYRSRVNVMDAALREHLGEHAVWQRPGGGYFFWLELDADVDAAALKQRALELETGFQPGVNFSSRGGLKNHLRLSFAHYGEADIRRGVERLGRLFRTR